MDCIVLFFRVAVKIVCFLHWWVFLVGGVHHAMHLLLFRIASVGRRVGGRDTFLPSVFPLTRMITLPVRLSDDVVK